MRVSSFWLLAMGIPLLHASNPPGLKIVTRHTIEGMPSERTEYFQQDRKRTEHRSATGGEQRWDGSVDVRYGPRIATIIRCDLGQAFDLNLDTREYQTAPYPPKPLSEEEKKARGWKLSVAYLSDKTTLRIETTTADTGERKEIFGHAARHVITTRIETPLQGSKRSPQHSVTDGWYIDLDTSISCDQRLPKGKGVHVHAYAALALAGENPPLERVEFIEKGEPETGFGINRKITYLEPSTRLDVTKGAPASALEMQVIELVEGPLDPALFEIPPGFRQVQQIQTGPPSIVTSEWSIAWERVKAAVLRLFR